METSQWLRTPATVAENPDSVPISHVAAQTVHNSIGGASHALELELQMYIKSCDVDAGV